MRDRGIGSGGAMGWFLQRLTGIVLAPIILVHLLAMHRWTAHGLPWAEVAARLSNPYWKVLEIVFLVIAIYHGLNGLYTIFQDYVKTPWKRLTLFGCVALLALVLLAFGVVTVVSFPQVGLDVFAQLALP